MNHAPGAGWIAQPVDLSPACYHGWPEESSRQPQLTRKDGYYYSDNNTYTAGCLSHSSLITFDILTFSYHNHNDHKNNFTVQSKCMLTVADVGVLLGRLRLMFLYLSYSGRITSFWALDVWSTTHAHFGQYVTNDQRLHWPLESFSIKTCGKRFTSILIFALFFYSNSTIK